VKWILGREERLIIGVGSSQYSHSLRNPFTLGERVYMIWQTLIEEGVYEKCVIVPIPDTDSKHAFWVRVVKYCSPPFSKVYSNDPLTTLLFEEENIPVDPIPFFNREKYEGTYIRKLIAEGNPLWEDLVPSAVRRIIKEIGGDKRIKKLYSLQKIIK